MSAYISARRRYSATIVALGVCLVLVLGACETDPATNVTGTEATLHAKGKCYTGLNGWSRFQLRDATAGGSFVGVGDRYVYNCGGNTDVVQFEPRRIGGLTPGRTYQFRLRTELNNGQKFWTDSVGTQGGTNYDTFTTRFVDGRETQSPDPGNVPETCTPGNPDDACSSADNIQRKKNPLRNRFLWTQCIGCLLLEQDIAEHMSFVDWSFNLTTQNIRKIHSRTHEVNCLANVGSCAPIATYWRLAECDRSGPDTCLFRSEGWSEYSLVIRGVTSTRQLISCLGTRIRWDGSHVRSTFEGRCSHIGSARASVGAQELRIDDVPVGRHLTRDELRAFDRHCIGGSAKKRACKLAGIKLYNGLPDRLKARIQEGS